MAKTFTYTADPANSEVDFVRDRIGDTDDQDPLLFDEEIQVEIDAQPSLLWAAAKCAEKLRNRFAKYVTAKVGNDSENLSDRFKHYAQMAIDLSDEARADTASYRSGVRTSQMNPATRPANYIDRAGDCGLVVKKA